jgi:bifunctional DNA-binding transcriptional regulator/antitoxin component of YhaV-PrlF toxin-antitoxin module
MPRGFARLRERNQLTLPQALVDKMGLGLGDLVEFVVTDHGVIEVHPARIVTMGTREAEREEEAAKEDIRQGRYSLIRNLDEFQQHVDRVRQGDVVAQVKGEADTPIAAARGQNNDEAYNARMASLYGEVVLKEKPEVVADGFVSLASHLSPQQRQEVQAIVEAVLRKT